MHTDRKRITLRSRVVSTLTHEIAQNDRREDFLLASEYTLCRRFNISRVTLRLALGDLENQGLIYRRHGKGTFAIGHSRQETKSIGVFCRSADAFSSWPVSELLRGIHSVQGGRLDSSLLLSTPSGTWSPQVTKTLGGLVILPGPDSAADLEFVRESGIPYLVLEGDKEIETTVFVGISHAAQVMTELLLLSGHQKFAFLVGPDLPWAGQMREGIHRALRSVGMEPSSLHEIPVTGRDTAHLDAVRALFELNPKPTAVVAADDNLAALIHSHAKRRNMFSVPRELSIVSLCELPYFSHLDPQLSNVQFRFFEAGQHLATALNEARASNKPAVGKEFTPVYRQGETAISALHSALSQPAF